MIGRAPRQKKGFTIPQWIVTNCYEPRYNPSMDVGYKDSQDIGTGYTNGSSKKGDLGEKSKGREEIREEPKVERRSAEATASA